MKLLECCLLFFLLSSFTVSALGTDEYRPYLHAAIVPEHPPLNLYGKYQTNLFQGSSTFTYPFTVPPGTNGLAPDVKISQDNALMFLDPAGHFQEAIFFAMSIQP